MILNNCLQNPSDWIGLDEALTRHVECLKPAVGAEIVPLCKAHGRILASDLVSAIDSPPFASAAMDGFAVRNADLSPSEDGTSLRVVARIAAGHPIHRRFEKGEAARIFTGATMPPDLDTVVMQEDCAIDEYRGQERVHVPARGATGRHVRRAGSDFTAETIVLRAGRRLRPQHVALAATAGRSELSVYRPLRVMLFSSGDEIVEPGIPLPPGAVYTSNRFALAALAEGFGCLVTDMGNLPDRFDATCQALSDAAKNCDLLITSGGVSVGGEDHIRAAVQSLGMVHPWKLAIKPGKPTALGSVGETCFVGLPGYPVAAQVAFMIFARPVILKLSGATADPTGPWRFKVPAAAPFTKNHTKRQFVRAQLQTGPDGETQVVPYGNQGTSVELSLTDSDGLVDMREDIQHIAVGECVDFIPYNSMQF